MSARVLVFRRAVKDLNLSIDGKQRTACSPLKDFIKRRLRWLRAIYAVIYILFCVYTLF